MITLKLEQFSYNKATRLLTAEISDFKDKFVSPPEEIMVGPSPRTGKYCAFRNPRAVKDREGDVNYWEYYAPAEDLKLNLWND